MVFFIRRILVISLSFLMFANISDVFAVRRQMI